MTFAEFFKKKKIDLLLLEKAEPELFAEFKIHYELMGEKSFDHTKKYWFNNLRRLYHTAEEPKVEKVKMENQIAEQTVTESLNEKLETAPPKVGFKPKFKAAGKTEPPAELIAQVSDDKQEADTAPPAETAKLGFKPKFKTAANPLPAAAETNIKPGESVPAKAVAPIAPKLGFKPKFKATTEKPADETISQAEPAENITPVEEPAPKLGFKPKFKATTEKPAEETISQAEPAEKGDNINEPSAQDSELKNVTGQPEIKSAYKPRFQMKNMKPKPDEGE